ncbi:alpha-1,3-mannosyl-glycoprotein 4-beta-N-acetylglucosaminyltransferase C-like [Boleophthalmus pectinirostris]|uniref:alpha-1,3-mannosyl-glycoprotein 4-beta-N-acetylglucosaminyltransferase C-like n=1 Tax=Boleophthalmus pectinirostris TaxID=150288 RepID=UPI00242A450C|nr:alpha-1,3-mannosyl-glycoprotein 4-beta-N-acetylglucosaminyltransferase C-like [Boleophthalmus pectinirostris]
MASISAHWTLLGSDSCCVQRKSFVRSVSLSDSGTPPLLSSCAFRSGTHTGPVSAQGTSFSVNAQPESAQSTSHLTLESHRRLHISASKPAQDPAENGRAHGEERTGARSVAALNALTDHSGESNSHLPKRKVFYSSFVGIVVKDDDDDGAPKSSPLQPYGRDIERVDSYKYLGVHVNNKLDWTHNTDALYRKGQSRLYLLRRLRSFGVGGPLLKTFYDSVVASAILPCGVTGKLDMARLWKKKALAFLALLIAGWMFAASRLGSSFSEQNSFSPLQLFSHLPQGEWSASLPLNVSYQLLLGSKPTQQKFLAVGISSVQRKKDLYLVATLESVFSQSSETERAQMVVVVLIADFDNRWRQFVMEEIQKKFPSELEHGQLLLIHVPKEFYPPLTGLKRNYNDAADRVTFRSKQNVDYSYLVHYSSTLGQYYLQLEDDVYCAKNFLSKIQKHIMDQNNKKTTWATLEFSSLGYIGKLYKSADLPVLARFLFLFYQEMPCDWLLTRFRDLLSQTQPIVLRPSLFQHMGTISSFRGTYNHLKDLHFDDGYSTLEASVFTNMTVYQKHLAHFAWIRGDDFFWARSPANGDYLTVVLKNPVLLTKILIETGDGGKDILKSAVVEIGKDVISTNKDKRSCEVFVLVGKMENGQFEKQDLDKIHNFSVSCLRIRVTAGQSDWMIVKRIRVGTKPDNTTAL